jgi:hypothetical protein
MPAHRSLWDRVQEGSERLMGLPPRGLLDPSVQNIARQRGLLAMGSNLLQSANTMDPNRAGLAGALGAGLEAGRAGAAEGVEMGQGVQAQQMMMQRRAVLQKYARRMDDPAALVQAANELMQLGDQEGATALLTQARSLGESEVKEGVGPGGEPGFFRVPQRGAATRVPGVAPATEDKSFDQENALYGRYIQQTAPFQTVAQSYGALEAATKDHTGASDMALIFSYMKMLDPGSSVREGEYATAQNTGSVPERVRAMYNQIVGGTKLTDVQRNEFVKQARLLAASSTAQLHQLMERYRDTAKRYGLNPANVVYDYFGAAGPRPPVTPRTGTVGDFFNNHDPGRAR